MISKILMKYRLRKIRKTFKDKSCAEPDTVFMLGAICNNNGKKENISIGKHCTIGANFMALCGGKINIGENVYIGPQSCIQSKESVIIHNNVIIANNVLIIDNNNHPVDAGLRLEMSACSDFLHDELWTWKSATSRPIVIDENVWIGRDSRIMKGVHIGRGSIVALGSIVTHDVPEHCIVAGNPAVVVKRLKNEKDKI